MVIDYSNLIQSARRHIVSEHRSFPSNTPQFLALVRKALAEKSASPEQQTELVALEKELAELRPVLAPSFLGSSATAL